MPRAGERSTTALLCLLALSLGALVPASAQEPGIITTVAGSSTTTADPGSEGDGGPATEAKLWYPYDVVVAPDGDVYVSDHWNYRIRRVDGSTGIISTYAGTGEFGYSGDGGPANQAKITYPRGLAIDPQGNLVFADDHNNRIRKVDEQTGVIETIAGTGAKGADPNGDGGPAIEASFEYPFDVAYAPDGTLYVADTFKDRIRKIDPQTQIITTVAGSEVHGYSGDGGPAKQAALNTPYAVAVGPDHLLYIADTHNNRIRRVNQDGTIRTVVGNGTVPSFSGIYAELPGGWPGELVGDYGPAKDAIIQFPYGVDFDPQGRMLIADTYDFRIRRVEADGTIVTVAGNGRRFFENDDGKQATQAAVYGPFGIDVDPEGNLYFAQSGSHRVRKVQAPLVPAPRFAPEATEITSTTLPTP